VQRLGALKHKLSSDLELAPQAAGKFRRAFPLAGNTGNTGRQKLKNLGVS
jgi:inorganic triphosphatase YgiF